MASERDPVPLYHQVRNLILERINSGAYKPGDRLPSEQELSAAYGVSIITVKRAMVELANEGVVYRKQGKGTFVQTPVLEEDLSLAVALAKPVLMHAETGYHRVISIQEVESDVEVSKALSIPVSSKVTRIERLKIVNGEPLGHERSFVPSELCPGLGEKMASGGATLVYEVLEAEYSIRLVRARLFIEPTILREREATLLGTSKGKAAMLWTRITYTVCDRPVEYYKAVVRGDRFKYYIEFPSAHSKL